LKHFLITLFIRQNKHHKHSVLIHTLLLFYYCLISGKFKFLTAALLHDIGKPFVAKLKKDNYNYSFTNHEEKSYQIIKNWFFISNYTKLIVRYHYIRRRIVKDKIKLDNGITNNNGCEISENSINILKETYNNLNIKRDLRLFGILDDKAKK